MPDYIVYQLVFNDRNTTVSLKISELTKYNQIKPICGPKKGFVHLLNGNNKSIIIQSDKLYCYFFKTKWQKQCPG